MIAVYSYYVSRVHVDDAEHDAPVLTVEAESMTGAGTVTQVLRGPAALRKAPKLGDWITVGIEPPAERTDRRQ